MLESNVWGENSFLFIHTTWIGNGLLKIRKMNGVNLFKNCIFVRHYSSRHLENKISQTSRPLSPSRLPLRARLKERRLGTRQQTYSYLHLLS